jgi:hypothetical protein
LFRIDVAVFGQRKSRRLAPTDFSVETPHHRPDDLDTPGVAHDQLKYYFLGLVPGF